MIFVGIDPGLDGALVALREDGSLHSQAIMPTTPGPSKGRVVDVRALARILLDLPAPVVVAVEAMAGRPPGKMGGGSALTIGANWGRIVGMLDSLAVSHGHSIAYEIVQPQRWQREVCPGTGDPKGRAVSAELRLCPGLNLTPGKRTKPHDGLADAWCIAEWCRRTLGARSSA